MCQFGGTVQTTNVYCFVYPISFMLFLFFKHTLKSK